MALVVLPICGASSSLWSLCPRIVIVVNRNQTAATPHHDGPQPPTSPLVGNELVVGWLLGELVVGDKLVIGWLLGEFVVRDELVLGWLLGEFVTLQLKKLGNCYSAT